MFDFFASNAPVLVRIRWRWRRQQRLYVSYSRRWSIQAHRYIHLYTSSLFLMSMIMVCVPLYGHAKCTRTWTFWIESRKWTMRHNKDVKWLSNLSLLMTFEFTHSLIHSKLTLTFISIPMRIFILSITRSTWKKARKMSCLHAILCVTMNRMGLPIDSSVEKFLDRKSYKTFCDEPNVNLLF